MYIYLVPNLLKIPVPLFSFFLQERVSSSEKELDALPNHDYQYILIKPDALLFLSSVSFFVFFTLCLAACVKLFLPLFDSLSFKWYLGMEDGVQTKGVIAIYIQFT